MLKQLCASALALLALVSFAAVIPTAPAPAPKELPARQADVETLWPTHQCQALPGKAVGVLVGEGGEGVYFCGPAANTDLAFDENTRRSFSRDAQNYREFAVPAADEGDGKPGEVRGGERGEWLIPFPALAAPTATNLARWGMPAGYCLVEVDVNHGLGAPQEEGAFVATHIRVVEGSEEYPLRVTRCVAETKKLYRKYLDGEVRRIDSLVEVPRKEGVVILTPPDELTTVPHVTWLSGTGRLRVVYSTPVIRAGRGDEYFGAWVARAYELDKKGNLVRALAIPTRSYSGWNYGKPCD